MTTKLRQGPKGRKAGVRLCLSPDNQVHFLPLRALLPGAHTDLTMRGPGAVEWVAFLEGRAA